MNRSAAVPTPTDVLSYEVRDHKAYITMNRPERMNALSRELMHGLAEAFGEADGRHGDRAVL